MTKKKDEWIFMDEAAEVAGCSKSTIYAKMKEGLVKLWRDE